jgi:hypothetical protein
MIAEKPEDRNQYLASVLRLYLEMPETPLRAGPSDRERAADLYQRQVSITIVESALLLGSLRRLGRPPESPRLSPIRSLAYFMPVIEELLANPFPNDYLDYLRYKIRKLTAQIPQPDQTGIGPNKYVSS